MDPLSDVLSLLKLESYRAGGFELGAQMSVGWPQHPGIKCYTVSAGTGYLSVEGVAGWVTIEAGDCFILPRGLPFRLATDPNAPLVDFMQLRDQWLATGTILNGLPPAFFLIGGHFAIAGGPAEILRSALPPIVHLRSDGDRRAMRWSIERIQDEIRKPQPGSDLLIKQLAQAMLVQALRLHLAEPASGAAGWLAALADQQMSLVLTAMHDNPGRPWTLQTLAACAGMSRSAFAERFKLIVGTSPMEYLTRWRMLLAGNRLRTSPDSVAEIATATGYDSESAFGKAFKRTMRCSPRQFRRGEIEQEDLSLAS